LIAQSYTAPNGGAPQADLTKAAIDVLYYCAMILFRGLSHVLGKEGAL
jgi:hypothetical protein